jgi:hypothetical protein
MAMTSFQSTNLAVAGGSCGLSMWDLVEEKRFCYHETPSSVSRATAICQVTRAVSNFAFTRAQRCFASPDRWRQRRTGLLCSHWHCRRLDSCL